MSVCHKYMFSSVNFDMFVFGYSLYKNPPLVFCYLEGPCLVPSMGAVLRRHDFCSIDL